MTVALGTLERPASMTYHETFLGYSFLCLTSSHLFVQAILIKVKCVNIKAFGIARLEILKGADRCPTLEVEPSESIFDE
jgi:hypothetical protein